MIPALTILCGMSGFAQGDAPLTLGEFLVYVSNSSNNLYISVDASGTVGGSRCDWYPVTHAYDHRDTTWLSLALEQLDRSGCPGYTGDQYFAYGAYTVTIENNSIVMTTAMPTIKMDLVTREPATAALIFTFGTTTPMGNSTRIPP